MPMNRSRRIERLVTARDLAERLLPDLNMNELLLWAPDLFAYTSYIMSQTGTYQTVVSPPTGRSWAPKNKEILELIGTSSEHIFKWLKNIKLVENESQNINEIIENNDAETWILDPQNWEPNEGSGYFNETDVKRWKDEAGNLDQRLADIASIIHKYALESLKKPLLSKEIERIKRKSPSTKFDSKIEKKIEKEAIKELEKIKFSRPELKSFLIQSGEYKSEEEIIFERKTPFDEEDDKLLTKYEEKIRNVFGGKPKKIEDVSLLDLLEFDEEQNWVQLVQLIGDEWEQSLNQMSDDEFFVINDGERETDPKNDIGELLRDDDKKIIQWTDSEDEEGKEGKKRKQRYDITVNKEGHINREKDALGTLLKHTPPLLLAMWAYFYNEVTDEHFYGEEKKTLSISDLLCNQDHLQDELLSEMENFQHYAKGINADWEIRKLERLWKISIALLTMHATADICCTSWGLKSVEKTESHLTAQKWAERLLFSKGSLATINPERCRVVPKRHNPQVGITLRSLSSNLAFHNSSVEVVWRKTANTRLEKYLDKDETDESGKTISLLLVPYPFEIKSREFEPDKLANEKVKLPSKYGFFGYNSPLDFNENDKNLSPDERDEKRKPVNRENDIISNIIAKAKEELGEDNPYIDAVVFPEIALSMGQFKQLEDLFKSKFSDDSPSLFIAGVREARYDVVNELEKRLSKKGLSLPEDYDFESVNFNRNAVYCKYYDTESGEGYGDPTNEGLTPKYKQYKHHRWKLDASQIDRYGLSQILNDEMIWWESIKIPRRRVSFLNVGRHITIANLICEDLARQDPIADLIRHVGPSLVITLLMDGPQLRNRWSSRYASILSDDPGSSVITLTSWGMVKRHSSNFALMSRIVALWSESDSGMLREIELAEGAQAILLNLKLNKKNEKTADGREERFKTGVLRLKDVIQIYPD